MRREGYIMSFYFIKYITMFIKFSQFWDVEKVFRSHFVLLLVFIMGIVTFFSSFFVVDPWEVILVKTLGQINPDVYTEWLHRKTPFIGRVVTISTRSKKLEDATTASTNDLQSIGISVVFTYQTTKEWVTEIFRRFGDDDMVASNVAIPSMKESVRSVIAKYKADELITKRAEVSSLIQDKLQNKLNEFWLLVTDINIQDVTFSPAFNDSIEAKVKAEQDALAKRNELEKTKYEAEQQVVRAKAEAETIRIQAEAIKSQWGSEYVQMKWIEKWNGVLPQTQLGSSSNTMMMLK